MENILYNISQVLGITILHSLWQGLLIYFMLRLALMLSGRLSSASKYMMSVSSLMATTVWFLYTLLNEIHIYNWIAEVPAKFSAMPLMTDLPSNIDQFNDQTIRYYYSIERYLPYITIIYIGGLLFNLGRLLLARQKINAIKQSMSIDIALQHKVIQFTKMMNISQKVRIGLSKLVDVPCMVGYFKPVILLPFTLSTYLSAEEIEAIVLHELAHIKRNDYLVNLLQQIVSILLFFNPCTQLINRIINEERENCCDDLVVNVTTTPLIYAKALFKLEQTRENNYRLAMAATGKKYQLLNRIERIMKTNKTTQSLRPAFMATLVLTIGIGITAMLSPEIAQGKISVKAITPIINSLLADTAKKPVKKVNPVAKATVAKKPVHTIKHFYYSGPGDDKKLDELNADIQKQSEELNKMYNNDEFKATQHELEEKGKEIQEYYNRPEMKKMQEDMAKASEAYAKNWGQNDKLKNLSAQMGEKGHRIGAYYSSPEFKKMNAELETKYGIPHDRNYYGDDAKDENYKKYKAELESRIPQDVKLQQEDLAKMGKQMSSRYESPEFKQQDKRLREMSDSIRLAFDNTKIKDQQKDMERLAKKMTSYQNSAMFKQQKEQLDISIRKMTDYINSPEYKKRLMLIKKNYADHFDYDFDFDGPGKPGKPIKPVAPEKPEAPEVQAPPAPVIPIAPNGPPAPASPINN